MAINLTKIFDEIQIRNNAVDSNTSSSEQLRLNSISNRMNSMGGVLTYRSTGHLPSTADSGHIGSIAYVAADNVFGDSSGAFYMATFRDSNWVKIPSLQDSGEAAIPEPSGGGGAEPSVRQASNYGFIGGGTMPSIAPAWDYIQKFSLTVDGNATDVGNLIDRISQSHGASSATHGYMMGGFIGHGPNAPSVTNAIQKFSHTVDGDATDVADLLSTIRSGGGGYSPTHGYQFGGDPGPTNQIQKFEFATDGNSTDVANLTAPTRYNSGIAISSTHIYNMGGYPGTTPTGDYVETIEKFPFAADGDATDAGDLSAGVAYHSGNQSTTHGYRAGGNGAVPAPGSRNEIEKFEFATDGNAADVGDLTLARYSLGNGVSSTTHGYTMGGYGGGYSNIIDKYSFVSGGNAVDVGDTLAGMNGYGSSQN